MTHHSNMAPGWIDKGAAGGPTRWVVHRPTRKGQVIYTDHALARLAAKSCGGRVVALLTHEQSKAKAQAMVLLAAAEEAQILSHQYAHQGADDEADALGEFAETLSERAEKAWPARGRGRGR